MNVFLNLDSTDFLVEYIYYDNNAPEIINTDTAPFYFMANAHNGSSLLMQQDGLEAVTNNTRTRSIVDIETISKSFALLTPNKLGVPYNDFDAELTNTASLPLVFSNPEGVIYDTVRVHLIQGFSFNDYYSGINLDIKVKAKDGAEINLLSIIYKKEDSFAIMNANPFLYSGRQYSSYIEFKVPSLKYLIDSYTVDYVQGLDSDILAYKITNGNGFYNNALIEISAGRCSTVTKLDNQLYTTRITGEATSVSSQDEFSSVGVYVNESLDGDYIEFYGTHNGAIFGDYMTRLNNSDTGQHIAIHKLIITEQLPNTTGIYNLVGQYNPLTNIPDLSDNVYLANFTDGDYWVATQTGYAASLSLNVVKGNFMVYNPSLPGVIKVEVIDSYDIENYADIAQFIRSSDQEFIQDSNFEDPNNFRPVLNFGGSSLSYKISYTMQIFNTTTNSVVEKFGSYVSFYPQKYGKELLKINTRDNIKIFDVFNKKVTTNIQQTNTVNSTNSIEGTSLYSKNLTAFKQSNDVYSGVTEVSINVDGKIVPSINPESITNIKGQGTATVYISPFDTFLQFGLYEQIDNGTFRSLDLTKIGNIYLNFTNKNGEILKISNTNNQNVDESKGQILFRIQPDIYNQVINSGSDVFFITSKVGDNSPETPLYTGKYKDYASITTDETELLINQQRQTILDLNTFVAELEGKLVSAENALTTGTTTVVGPTGDKPSGLTADNKSVNKNSMNIKNSTFNPWGPESPTSS